MQGHFKLFHISRLARNVMLMIRSLNVKATSRKELRPFRFPCGEEGQGSLPEGENGQRPVGFVAGVAAQVASPEVIFPDVTQRSGWVEVLEISPNGTLV